MVLAVQQCYVCKQRTGSEAKGESFGNYGAASVGVLQDNLDLSTELIM